MVRQKGADEFSVQAAIAFLQELGHVRYDIQTDGEPAILALIQAVRSSIAASEARQVSTRRSPVHSHASNGAAEVAVKIIKGLMRTGVLTLKGNFNMEVKVSSALMSWFIRHSAWIYCLFQRLKGGAAPHEKLKFKRYAMPLLELDELVTARQGREPDSSIDARWSEGFWLGRSVGTGEHIVGLPTGVLQTRAVKAVPKERQWSKDALATMVWAPWHTNEAADSPPEVAQWSPTTGCAACEEEASSVPRKRGRPRHHTAACMQRRA